MMQIFNQLRVYPNPVENEINISSNQPIIVPDLIIIDPLGREIKPKISSILSDKCLKLDVSQLTSGVYHLATRTENGNTSTTFVISRN